MERYVQSTDGPVHKFGAKNFFLPNDMTLSSVFRTSSRVNASKTGVTETVEYDDSLNQMQFLYARTHFFVAGAKTALSTTHVIQIFHNTLVLTKSSRNSSASPPQCGVQAAEKA